tara:strand:+ start:8 stop:913 length:906 start_codon:yes stop_codon:yes gene_type:complete
MDKNYLIKKWLENSLTIEEEITFNKLEDNTFFNEIIEEGKRFKGQNPYEVNTFENLENKLDKKQSSSFNWTKIITRIAAVFIVGLGLYSLFNKDQHRTFETQLAQTEQITLPNNSIVTLNELSQLGFDDKNWDKKRSVELSGEAYFKVAKGKRFDVNTAFGNINVLGTQFNVIARDSIFSVICYEGLVQVIHNTNKVQLPAGKAYRVVKGKTETFDIAVIQPEWLQNMKVFEQANIGDVFASMESHYNIKIITDDIDSSILFTGAFELDNLENALKATTESLNLTYVMNNKNEVVIKNAKE